jgi:hypothetical protein
LIDCALVGLLPISEIDFSSVPSLPNLTALLQLPPGYGFLPFGTYPVEDVFTAFEQFYTQFEYLSVTE